MAERDPSFLTRWARRKSEARPDPSADMTDDTGTQHPGPQDSSLQPPDRAQMTEADRDGEAAPDGAAADGADIIASLPDVESLEAGSDFSQFMRPGVPDELRRLALRRLWRVNPVFGFRDGLNEYDEDFRLAMSLAEPVKTIWQVGKGMVSDEPAADESREGEPPAGAAPEAVGETAGEMAAPQTAADTEAATAGGEGTDPVPCTPEARPEAEPAERERDKPRRSARDRRWSGFRT